MHEEKIGFLVYLLLMNIPLVSWLQYPSFFYQPYRILNNIFGYGLIIAVPVLLIMGILYPSRYIVFPQSVAISKLVRCYLIVVMANIIGSFTATVYALITTNNVDLAGWWQLILVFYACFSVCVGLVFMMGYRLWQFKSIYTVVFAVLMGLWSLFAVKLYTAGLVILLIMHLVVCLIIKLKIKRGK